MERIVVVGGDAAGMSAAHQALRTARTKRRDVDVVVLEKTSDTSYSACGIPYLVGGLVDSTDDLTARTPAQHREMGVDLRLGTTVTGFDISAQTVTTWTDDGVESELHFDELVLATGAHATVPPWARDRSGALIDGVHPAKTLEDARYWLDLLIGSGRRGVVVGGGYIGLEMAEALAERGFDTTLLTRTTVMSKLDPEMSARIESGLVSAGVEVLTGTVVTGADRSTSGTIRSLTTASGREIPVDVVVLALGVGPSTSLGAAAGVPIGVHGGYLPDDRQRVADNVWAAGDCCEVVDRITGTRMYAPLGTHANKQGRVCGYNVAGDDRRFPGVLGTAITRFVSGATNLEIARTGLSTEVANRFGYDVFSLITESNTASGYLAAAAPIATLITADRSTRRLLGAQIVGGPASGKRIDTVAAALWGQMTVDDLAEMDLAYAPPFATVWEAVQLAARRVAERM